MWLPRPGAGGHLFNTGRKSAYMHPDANGNWSPNPKARSGVQTTQSAIKVLPDFILHDIFKLDWADDVFPPEGYYQNEHEKSSTRNIVRVCKRFRDVCTPLLYRNINVKIGSSSKWDSSRFKLIEALEKDTHLQSFTRSVSVLVDGLSTANFGDNEAQDIVKLLRWWRPNLCTVELHGCIESPTMRPILYKLSQLPLEDVRLSGYHNGISITFFLKYFQYSGFKKLHLNRAAWTEDPDVVAPPVHSWPWVATSIRSAEETYLAVDRQYTADIRSLSLTEPYSPARAISTLIKWPKALESLSLHYLMHSSCREQYTPSAIEALLSLQASSLTKVSLGQLYKRDRNTLDAANIPDVSSLFELRHLSLSDWNLLSTPPWAACFKLAAPRLKCLVINFSTEDQHDEGLYDCDEKVRDWLVDFSKAWKSRNPHHCLECVHLKFRPDWYLYNPKDAPWPYRHLAEARTTMKGWGFRLTWHRDELTEEYWNNYVTDLRNEAQAAKLEREQDLTSHVDDVAGRDILTTSDPSQQLICRMLGSECRWTHD